MAKNPNSMPGTGNNQGESTGEKSASAFTAEQQKVINNLNARLDSLTKLASDLQDNYSKIIAEKDAQIAELKARAEKAEAQAAQATNATDKAKFATIKEGLNDEADKVKKQAVSKGVGAAAVEGTKLGFFASIKNAFMRAFGHDPAEAKPDKASEPDTSEADDDIELPPLPSDADTINGANSAADAANESQPTQPLDPNATQPLSGAETNNDKVANTDGETSTPDKQASSFDVISPDEGLRSAGATDTESEVGSTKEKKSPLRKKLGLGLAAAALVAAGIFGANQLAANMAAAQSAEAAAQQTETLNNETADLENVLDTDTASLSSDDLDAQLNAFNKEKGELSKAVEDNPNADQASVDEANNLLNSDEVKQYEATLASLIEARDARVSAAEELGASLDDYASYEQFSQKSGISIENVVKYANYYGISTDALGNPAQAQAQMRDNLLAASNVNEKIDAQTPQEAMEMMLFSCGNNNGMLAMMVNAMDEDGGAHDAGLDGLETPADIQTLYAKYNADPAAAEADYQRLVKALQNADIYQRDATSQYKYSMFISANNEMVCSYHPENDGGNEIVYRVTVYDEGGNVWFEFEFKQACGQLVAGGNVYTPSTPEVIPPIDPPIDPPVDPPVNPPVNPPVDPPVDPPVNPKDPTANDEQQNDAEGFEDDAPATDDDQVIGDDGVPEGDETGQIPGHQDTGDQDGDGAEDRPSEDNAVEGESAQTGNESGATDGLQSVTVGDDNLPGGGAGPAYDMGDGNIVYGDEALKEYLANQGASE